MKSLVLAAATLAATIGTGRRWQRPRTSPRASSRSASAGPAIRSAKTRGTRSGRCSTASKAASPARIAGYNYSEANKKAEITWSEATFKDYIQNPMAKVPGTKMAFAGIKNENEIADLWAYLKQFKADGSKKSVFAAIA